MMTLVEWAKSLDIPVEDIPPALEGHSEEEDPESPPRFSARDIAIRAVILQGVVAVGSKFDPELIIEWFHEQGIWQAVSPKEAQFLLAPTRSDKECSDFRWRQEAEWTLLWMLGKVETLGLPDHKCDPQRMVNDIIPEFGSDIDDFLESAERRDESVLYAEVIRTYDLWNIVVRNRRQNQFVPVELNFDVLAERMYAFDWLDGWELWDHVRCDI
ncbi:MAG: DUF4272 domain-containing protein [Chloroflexota bacterium]